MFWFYLLIKYNAKLVISMFCGNEHSVFKLKELHVKQRYFWRNKLARDANNENFLHSSINHLHFKYGFFFRNAFYSVLNFIDFILNITKKKLVRNLKHWLSKRWTVNYPSFFFLEICFSETCWTSLRFSRCMSASDLIFYSRKNIHKHVKWYNNTFAFMYEYCYQRNQKRKKKSYKQTEMSPF